MRKKSSSGAVILESRLAAAKQHALSQTETIDALFRTLDDISAEAKQVRLEMDKLVKARKDAIRSDIVASGVMALRDFKAQLNLRLGIPCMPAVPADFGGAIKGKRTIESLNDAVNTELARAKTAASVIADRIQKNLETLREFDDYAFLFSDMVAIALKAPDDLLLLVKSRIADHQQRETTRLETVRECIILKNKLRPSGKQKPSNSGALPKNTASSRMLKWYFRQLLMHCWRDFHRKPPPKQLMHNTFTTHIPNPSNHWPPQIKS